MANRTYNKVKIDGVVKLDLSSDTVTADKLLKDTTAHNHLGAAITGTYEPPTFTTQTKSATPTESTQEITPDASYDGLSKVTVGAISSTYVGSGVSKQAAKTVTPNSSTQTAVSSGKYTTGDVKVAAVPTETKSITTNGTHTPSSGKYFSSVTVAVPTSPTLQEKSATPSETAQDIVADTGYDGLSKVSVGAISSTYVGSGIARKSSTDLTASGATVSVPAGYYASNASKSVASGTAGTPSASKGTVSNNSVSVTPTVTNSTGYITGGTKNGTAVTVSASELVSGTKSITTTSSTDVTNYKNAQVSDTNLTGANIKKDVTILGVTGTYEGSGGSSGPVIQYSPSVSKITNNTSYKAAGAAITVKESGNYKCSWVHYASASSSSYYLTRLYKNGTAIGSTHASPAYNGTSSWAATESSISLSAGDTIQVYARTRSGSSYYTVAGMLVIEKI